MNHRKYLSILVILAMLVGVLVPSTVFAQGGNGSGGGGEKGSGTGQYGKGGTSSGVTEDDGEGTGNKGGVNRGGSGDRGSQKGSPKKDSAGGKITVNVKVLWPEGTEHPNVINVTLNKYMEDVDGEEIVISDTQSTVNDIATFSSEPTGDKCEIVAQDVEGFVVAPKSISLTGDVKVIDETLEYTIASYTTSVSLNKDQFALALGYEEQLIATVEPVYVGIQSVVWSSSDETKATVNENGTVKAVLPGEATITVTVTDVDGHIAYDSCLIKTGSIESLVNPDPIAAFNGEMVYLPESVEAILSNTDKVELPVVWKEGDEEAGVPYQVPEGNNVNLTGIIEHTDLLAELTINIINGTMPISVEPTTVSLYSGEFAEEDDKTYQLVATTIPHYTGEELMWTSSYENVATVTDEGLVTAVSPGVSIITVTMVNYGYKASCIVNVTQAIEPSVIFPCDAAGIYGTEFEDRPDVYINVENLIVPKSITENTKYYVKVEQKGRNPLLGSGEISIGPETENFNLFGVTGFEYTDNYSQEYFVSMSQDNRYPMDDEKTAMTNFKIGAAVPIIPLENIQVTAHVTDGYKAADKSGILFILCRELDESITNITWEDYLDESSTIYANDPYHNQSVLRFTDEVKLMGMTNSNGVVGWFTPKESVKLGGYILLEVTPEGYTDNLNANGVNPYGEGLLKEVTLMRDGTLVRDVYNVYVDSRTVNISAITLE